MSLDQSLLYAPAKWGQVKHSKFLQMVEGLIHMVHSFTVNYIV
jgi:hypothetical protein